MKLQDLSGVPELKHRLDQHPLYAEVRSLDDLRRFMAHHVFPVWDFMSLVKYLQGRVAPTHVPWLPSQDAEVTLMQRFINESVIGEETDEGLPDGKGKPVFVSHFDLYIGAMSEVGADTRPVLTFLKAVKKHGVSAALKRKDIPEPSRRFTEKTFGFIAAGEPHVVAAAFALGREQVIPGMFRALLAEFGIDKKKAPLFHYYLERHIHLDDEFHGPLSLQLLDKLCGGSEAKRRAAARAGREAIVARIELWDGVRAALATKAKRRK